MARDWTRQSLWLEFPFRESSCGLPDEAVQRQTVHMGNLNSALTPADRRSGAEANPTRKSTRVLTLIVHCVLLLVAVIVFLRVAVRLNEPVGWLLWTISLAVAVTQILVAAIFTVHGRHRPRWSLGIAAIGFIASAILVSI
jgi:hypothetical protein